MTKHILVVEDEAHLAIGIKYNLEAEGYQVTTVGDGPAALEVLENPSSDVALVILDLMLPGMSGYAVCDRLRAMRHDIPVMILSARTLSEDRTRGFDVGADQYMMKPFELEELISRVKNLLMAYARRTGNPAGSPAAALPKINAQIYQFADADINFTTYEVTVRGKPVRLTQLEMKLLHYFVENEGRVIPRAELLEKVWELPATIQTRAPDQFMRRLRKAFEPDPAEPVHFLTIRDVGYRFISGNS